ncbi:sensor histidine kinase [Serinicoccus kebangsaanensis]|uniref:sensor histidine kinase n=1 Tax=Serinicoccus kebangsaanensis TaxID=2602069 RepID=UPI00124D62B3|nr:histidine kinase [Serinicoccus kebangsaanensis]
MSDLLTRGSLRMLLQVTLNVRLASIVVIFLAGNMPIRPFPLVCAALAIAACYLPMRFIRRAEPHLAAGWAPPVIDAVISLSLLLLTPGALTTSFYVAASGFLWALTNRTWPTAIAVGPAFLVLGIRLADRLQDGDWRGYAGTLVCIVMIWLAVLTARRARRIQERHVALLDEASASRVRAAQAEERARLSIEMHDSVAKSLHGIHFMAEHLHQALADREPQLAQRAQILAASVAQARTEARTLVTDYREQAHEASFEQRLTELLDEWSSTHPEVEVHRSVPAIALGPGAAHEWLNAVGEALENVARHAGASTVSVDGTVTDGVATLRLTDDGRGMDAPDLDHLVEIGHFGLDGLHRRMRRVGGHAEVRPAAGKGTEVVLTGPVSLTGPSRVEEAAV